MVVPESSGDMVADCEKPTEERGDFTTAAQAKALQKRVHSFFLVCDREIEQLINAALVVGSMAYKNTYLFSASLKADSARHL